MNCLFCWKDADWYRDGEPLMHRKILAEDATCAISTRGCLEPGVCPLDPGFQNSWARPCGGRICQIWREQLQAARPKRVREQPSDVCSKPPKPPKPPKPSKPPHPSSFSALLRCEERFGAVGLARDLKSTAELRCSKLEPSSPQNRRNVPRDQRSRR